MKLSRSRSSLESVVRSNVIFDPDANVPSEFSVKEPFAPVAVRTASDGKLTPASCSRTRIVTFDLSVTVHAAALVVAGVVGVAAAVVAVALGLGSETVAAPPPQAVTSIAAKVAAAIE